MSDIDTRLTGPLQEAPPSAPAVAPKGALAARPWAYEGPPRAALDYAFTVRTTDPWLGELLHELFSTFERAESAMPTVYSVFECPDLPGWFAVYVDDRRQLFTRSASVALGELVWHLNQSTVRHSGRYVIVHASAAELSGIGLMFPAAMESGKTTLVAGLVLRGFRYLTDEAAALDPVSGYLRAYPKPLSIDRGSWGVLADLEPDLPPEARCYQGTQWHVPVTRIKPDAVVREAPPRLIVSPKYVAGATTALEPISRAEMLKVLCENTFNFNEASRRNLEALAEASRSSECYRLVVGDLGAACETVERLVAGMSVTS